MDTDSSIRPRLLSRTGLSYLAWFSGLGGGSGFEAYRWLGVFCLAAVLIATALLARSLFDRGVVAAWLIAIAPVAAASGAYARFYMPFAAVCTLTLVIAARMRDDPRLRAWFVAGCVAARSLHEFGMLLAIVPAAGWLCAESDEERRSSAWLLLATTAALVAEHTLLLWLPCIVWSCESATWGFSSSGLPTVASTALPVAAFAASAEIVFAIAAAAIAGGAAIGRSGRTACSPSQPPAQRRSSPTVCWRRSSSSGRSRGRLRRARSAAGLLAATAGSVVWIALIFVRGNALVDARFVWGLLQGSFAFPWSGIGFLVTEQPVAAAAITLGVWRGAVAASTRHTVPARTLAVLLYLELLSFGVAGMAVRARFLVLIMPLISVFAGAGILWLARLRRGRSCAARFSWRALWSLRL